MQLSIYSINKILNGSNIWYSFIVVFPLICTFDKSIPTMFMLWTLSNRKAKYSLPEGVKPNLTKSDADISFGYSE